MGRNLNIKPETEFREKECKHLGKGLMTAIKQEYYLCRQGSQNTTGLKNMQCLRLGTIEIILVCFDLTFRLKWTF